MSGKQRVVILGAGPAGITAAWRLSELGYAVTVLERDDAEALSLDTTEDLPHEATRHAIRLDQDKRALGHRNSFTR